MPSWKDEYQTSLQDVELKNPVNMELVQTCSMMADRISALEAEKAALEAAQASAATTNRSKGAAPQVFSPVSDDPGVAQLRLEVAEALRQLSSKEKRLRAAEEELIKLRKKTKEDSRSIHALEAEKTLIRGKLRDQDFELKAKKKLLEDVQDEMITLNLQMSMAEKERDKVKKENKELVDRWMKRMAQEADAMNLANEPLLDRNT